MEQRRAAAERGEQPRKDYLEMARILGDTVIIDAEYMERQAGPVARLVQRAAGMPAAQVTEVFLRRRRFGTIIAWADRLGVGLAVLSTLTRARVDIVIISVLLTRGAKGTLVQRLRILSRARVVVVRSLQARLLQERYGVAADKLVVERQAVDDRFFTPREDADRERMACVVGLEERDHATLLQASALIDGRLELAVGTIAEAADAPYGRARIEQLMGATLPPNVGVGNYAPSALLELYRRATCAVIAVHAVEFDAGVTAATEAMACGLPVVATRTPGLADLFDDGVEGIFVPPGEPAALAAAIQELLDDRARAHEMGAAARLLVERRHRLDDCLDLIAGAIRSGP